MSFQSLNIGKDGLTYIITVVDFEHNEFDGLMREDSDGWLLWTQQRDITYRIGRRKEWATALRDALLWIESHLKTAEAAP